LQAAYFLILQLLHAVNSKYLSEVTRH